MAKRILAALKGSGLFDSSRRACKTARLILALSAALSLILAPMPQSSAAPPAAFPLVTNRVNLPLSNLFGAPGSMRLTATGDVLFTGPGALFRWTSGSANRTRILQSGDEHPGFPGSLIDAVALSAVNSVGHVAMTNSFHQKGTRDRNGIFIFDGTNFFKVALRNEVAPGTGGKEFLNFVQLRINDGDQVAFVANFEPFPLGGAGLFTGSPTGPPSKIALIGEVAPGAGGGTFNNFQLIGMNNAGQVAFVSNVTGGTTARAVYIATSSSIVKVAANNDPAPGTTGTFRLPGNPQGFFGIPNYFLNASGDVAFNANVAGGAPVNRGIWIGNASGPPTKLVVNTDPTLTALGGTFNGGIQIRGFNNAGKVLFNSNLTGATSDHALFLKDLSSAAQVVFARNQAAPGGTTETFDFTQQAVLNNNGDVAFLASLQGGAFPFGWFLGSGVASPVKIAFEGEPTPVGGTFGLSGENVRPELNENSQVAFFSDILGLNGTGLFRWSPGSGNVSAVNTNDPLPAGANPVIRTVPGASDDQIMFYAFKTGGRITAFTKPLKPGGGQIARIFAEGDPAPGIGGALWFFNTFGLINNEEEVGFACWVIGGSTYPAQGVFTHKPGFGVRKIVSSGDPAPGAAGGTFAGGTFPAIAIGPFGNGGPPARINSQGQIAFEAEIVGSAGGSSPFGFFIGSATGGVQKIARLGDPSPIGGTIVDISSDTLSLNDAGQVVFEAISKVGSVDTNALFVGSGTGPPVKVVAQGDAVPGGNVSTIPFFFQMNNAGQVAYVVNLTGGSSTRGLFLGTAGGPQVSVALVGDVAPGTTGGTFSDFREQTMELNNLGQVAFWAGVAGSSATTGYFLGSSSSAPAARLVEGQALPGGGTAGIITPSTVNFVGDSIALADSGELAITVFIVNGAPNITRIIIAGQNGALRELVRAGETATGTGSSFGRPFQSIATNSAGSFFFLASLVEGPANSGIFTDK